MADGGKRRQRCDDLVEAKTVRSPPEYKPCQLSLSCTGTVLSK